MTETTSARPLDLARQIAVISALCFAIIAAAVGVGGLGGTSVQNSQSGALAADGSYLAPASSAFSIWSVIYLGLAVYTVWQAFPGQRASRRQRALGWLIALTMVLNGLWLVTAQFLSIWWTVVVIFTLLAALAVTFVRAVATRFPDDGLIDSVLIDGVTGLHFGWVTLASVANVAAALTDGGPASWGEYATPWGIGVLLVVLVIGVGIAWASAWRVTPGMAMGWGLAWIGVGRIVLEPRNDAIGWTAVVVGAIVGLLPFAMRGVKTLRPSVD